MSFHPRKEPAGRASERDAFGYCSVVSLWRWRWCFPPGTRAGPISAHQCVSSLLLPACNPRDWADPHRTSLPPLFLPLTLIDPLTKAKTLSIPHPQATDKAVKHVAVKHVMVLGASKVGHVVAVPEGAVPPKGSISIPKGLKMNAKDLIEATRQVSELLAATPSYRTVCSQSRNTGGIASRALHNESSMHPSVFCVPRVRELSQPLDSHHIENAIPLTSQSYQARKTGKVVIVPVHKQDDVNKPKVTNPRDEDATSVWRTSDTVVAKVRVSQYIHADACADSEAFHASWPPACGSVCRGFPAQYTEGWRGYRCCTIFCLLQCSSQFTQWISLP